MAEARAWGPRRELDADAWAHPEAGVLVCLFREPASLHEAERAVRRHRQVDTQRVVLVVPKLLMDRSADKLRRAHEVLVEQFTHATLQFNVLSHVWVPPHTRVPSAAHPHRIDYPKLLTTDPVVRFMGWEAGDVVRVDRPSETNGVASTHRLVVRPQTL